MPKIITRGEWGFPGWLRGTAPYTVDPKSRTEFFVHYNGGRTGGRNGVQVVRDVNQWHLNNGWAGIGYAWLVTQDGTIYEGRGDGYVGAHCPNHNRSAFSAQGFIGGDEEPSLEMKTSLRWLYDRAVKVAGRPLEKDGHRDGISTDCPWDKLYVWTKAGMIVPGGAITPPPAFLARSR